MRIKNKLENIIIIAIILVIIHTFLSEVSVYSNWSILWKNILALSGFGFDLLFTIEFIVRSIVALFKRRLIIYWLYERGWVDFLSSVPLLALDSGFAFKRIAIDGGNYAGSILGEANVLKVVKAVRVTRILRLMRIIKRNFF